MKSYQLHTVLLLTISLLFSCAQNTTEQQTASTTENTSVGAGQSAVQDDVSQKNIVQIAAGSPDHTTLVEAVKAAGLADALANAGPFTVFAPTNDAFKKLPEGTVEGLLKPENIDALKNVLEYHVTVAVFKTENLTDGQILGQVNGNNATIKVNGDKFIINEANILTSIPASNGIIHVIDQVLLPPAQ